MSDASRRLGTVGPGLIRTRSVGQAQPRHAGSNEPPVGSFTRGDAHVMALGRRVPVDDGGPGWNSAHGYWPNGRPRTSTNEAARVRRPHPLAPREPSGRLTRGVRAPVESYVPPAYGV